ncbi:MAG: glucose 1-dehydrogenase [Porticoccaceae bacterium]|nr:glucose 1-dehydrogenase [Pseudomonadales bacterium]MCP5171429.1 glucose 1-dehydrogenase [Pseudomonadales bacterium]
MTEELQGKVAIVTGAARGLGRAYAHRLAKLGADVVVTDINLNSAKEFGEELTKDSVVEEIEALGRSSIGVEGDLTNPEAVEQLFEKTLQRFGRVDILVNNAGGAIAKDSGNLPTKTSLSDLKLLMDVNFQSAFLCCKAVAPIMKKQKSGIIINTSSLTAISTLTNGVLAGYGAAKAAVEQYSRGLAAELGPYGIRVNILSPGIMMTARIAAQAKERGIGTESQAEAVPLRRLGVAEDCAGVVEFLATDLSRYVTGQCISVCGGAALHPN